MADPQVTVDGDAEHGWHVNVHDGETSATYSPEAATADEAKEKALAEHAEATAQPQSEFARIWAHIEALFAHTGAPKP